MLVIANGAYKSGSTWLFRAVQAMRDFALPPEVYGRADWAGTGVRPEMLRRFLDEVDYVSRDYIFKAHLYYKAPLVMDRPHVRVLNISRDLRDVVVSAYHYERLKSQHSFDSFEQYYWKTGRHIAHYICHYNGLWSKPNNAFFASYEALHSDFPAEIRRVAGFLGMNLNDSDIARIQACTTLDQMRAQYNDTSPDGQMQFYRKGVVGDWHSHFDPAALADITRIESRHANYPNAIDRLLFRVQSSWQKPEKE